MILKNYFVGWKYSDFYLKNKKTKKTLPLEVHGVVFMVEILTRIYLEILQEKKSVVRK